MMKNKLISSVLLLVMVALCFFGGVACSDHIHVFGEWTVTKEATCSVRGKKVRSCQCGAKEEKEIAKDQNAHAFNSWTVVSQSTCTVKGKEKRSCACGKIEERELPLNSTAHSFGNWQTSVEPTCTTEGKEVRTCACGESEQRQISASTGHNFGNWMTQTVANCSSKGKEFRVCKCGAKEERDVEKNTNVHSYGIWQIENPATCLVKGKEFRVCKCGAKEEREISTNNNHSFGSWSVQTQPTCSTFGKEVRSCACGKVEERSINKTNIHTFAGTLIYDQDNHWYPSTCGHATEVSGKTAHSYGSWSVQTPSTCMTKGVEVRSCQCGYSQQRELDLNPNNHQSGEVEHLQYSMKNTRTGEATTLTTVVNIVKWSDHFTVRYDCTNSKAYSYSNVYNSDLYKGDVCEIFITVGSNRNTYYEIEVAPNNTVFFMKIRNNNGNLSSTPQINTLTTSTDIITQGSTVVGYSVVMEIPYTSVEYSLSSGAYFNAYRIETEGGALQNKHLLAVNPTMNSSFHTPNSFIDL